MTVARPLRAAIAAVALACASCGGESPIARWVPKRAPHEAYAESLRSAGLDAHAIGQAWIAAAARITRGDAPLAGGTRVGVLAAFNGFALVDVEGRRGWVRDGP